MRSHAADLIEITWAVLGFVPVDLKPGLAEGAHIIPTYSTDAWEIRPNGVGGTVRLFNPDRSGTLTVNIDRESKTHQQLVSIWNADLLTRSLNGPIVEFDGNTGGVATWIKAHIRTLPSIPRGTSSGIIPWVFNFETFFEQPFDFDANVVGA